MKRIVILTGDEIRHRYFRKKISNDVRFEVVCSFCEGDERSLTNKILQNSESSQLEKLHVLARDRSEMDFFGECTEILVDKSNPVSINKGDVNLPSIVKKIVDLNPDLLICYGSSLIKSELVELFNGRFLNVHLGLSPYYRGSGTNIWPLINNEPYMVGASYMFIDAGIDTGKLIHQIRADIFWGDSPHSIGNRLIRKMTGTYADIVANFDKLTHEPEIKLDGKLYMNKDFNAKACELLYQNFRAGMIENYLNNSDLIVKPEIVENKGMEL